MSAATGALATATRPPAGVTAGESTCVHCGLPAPAGRRFCCPGCAVAYETIQGLGLGRYYQQRVLDAAARALRPEPAPRWDLDRAVSSRPDGQHELSLAIDGLQCGACVWLIESVLARQPGVTVGRVNMTTRRLRLVWHGAAADAEALVGRIEQLGYRLVPFDANALARVQDATGRRLLRALAVAGFAAGNVMFLSIAVWSGGMGPATRDLLHWVSALIAMPAIVYAGWPFFASAAAALRRLRSNMDVPISIGVILVTGMSLVETMAGRPHTYFDSAIVLLFFLLIGRVLDHRARGQARATAEQLLTLRAADITVLQPDGSTRRRSQQAVAPGDLVLVGLGERVGVDGVVAQGCSALDASLVTGESLPVPAVPGTAVFAGTLNLGAALTVRATATGNATLLAECVRLIEAAEGRRGRFVVLADRVARRYAPTVHLCALLTFLFWYVGRSATLEQSLLTAAAVLIITCPCALALAVPAVQVIATARLFRAGILLKSATALERLAAVDTVVFDKTGTLTEPMLGLQQTPDAAALLVAASLAASSRHPLARSLCAAAGALPAAEGVVEHPGLGLSLATPAGEIRLGSRAFCGDPDAPPAAGPELWLARPGEPAVRFGFAETLRTDAAAVVARLHRLGLAVRLLSGDRPAAVARVVDALRAEARGGDTVGAAKLGVDTPGAGTLGIDAWQAACTPAAKVAAIEALAAAGRRVLMVGDGLNDGPSLAAASVSVSPASAADVSQTVADVVFQGSRLGPVVTVIETARQARAVMGQNLALSIGYNLLAVPLAVAGLVTPWLAAAAMSSSSLLVIANSFRLRRRAG